MFHRTQPIQNKAVARHMKHFFKALKTEHRSHPERVAQIYGEQLWHRGSGSLINEKVKSRSRFYVGLSTGHSGHDFESVTKRSALISDTLLLSHGLTTKSKPGVQTVEVARYVPAEGDERGWDPSAPSFAGFSKNKPMKTNLGLGARVYSMHCPSLADLGQWLLDAEPLLKAGLAWYLPSYSTSKPLLGMPELTHAIDYLINDGRAIDASGAEPIKSQLVRQILRIDIPFIDGVNLRDFSKITVDEFASYAAFRDFLRLKFLEIDESLNAVHSDRELVRIGLEIKEHFRLARSEMELARKKRAVATSGAAIGAIGAALVAVYGPALEAVIAAIGAGGGLWGMLHAVTENSTRKPQEDKWHYVWALDKNNIHVL